MRRISAWLFVVLTMTLLGTDSAFSAESLMEEFITAFQGRWVCEAPAVQDIKGYWKKGETIRQEIVCTPVPDLSGTRNELSFTKGGKERGTVRGISTWDAANKAIKRHFFAAPGFHGEVKITKDGDKWISTGHLTYPDGSVSHSTVSISFSEDGKTQKVVLSDGVDKDGEPLKQFTREWKRISKNREVLEKKLGWLIGEWEAKVDIPLQGTIPVKAGYKWVADRHVIQLDLSAGEWQGVSLIFYDPSDERIKMWGANSAGGNGQAVLEMDGDEFVWTNTAFEPDGQKNVGDFTYVKQADDDRYVVKYLDRADNKMEVTLKKRK